MKEKIWIEKLSTLLQLLIKVILINQKLGRNIVPENKIVFVIKKHKKVEDTAKFFLKSQFSHTEVVTLKIKLLK